VVAVHGPKSVTSSAEADQLFKSFRPSD
jgi:hypothetical protein